MISVIIAFLCVNLKNLKKCQFLIQDISLSHVSLSGGAIPGDATLNFQVEVVSISGPSHIKESKESRQEEAETETEVEVETEAETEAETESKEQPEVVARRPPPKHEKEGEQEENTAEQEEGVSTTSDSKVTNAEGVPRLVHFVLTDRGTRYFDWTAYVAVMAAKTHVIDTPKSKSKQGGTIYVHILDGIEPVRQ